MLEIVGQQETIDIQDLRSRPGGPYGRGDYGGGFGFGGAF